MPFQAIEGPGRPIFVRDRLELRKGPAGRLVLFIFSALQVRRRTIFQKPTTAAISVFCKKSEKIQAKTRPRTSVQGHPESDGRDPQSIPISKARHSLSCVSLQRCENIFIRKNFSANNPRNFNAGASRFFAADLLRGLNFHGWIWNEIPPVANHPRFMTSSRTSYPPPRKARQPVFFGE